MKKPITHPEITALKDPYYRRASGGSSNEHPAGPVELDDSELDCVNGGGTPVAVAVIASFRVCHGAGAAVLASAKTNCVGRAWKKITRRR